MNILALDIATRTGWASRINGVVESGVMDMKHLPSMAAKGWAFNKWVSDKIHGVNQIWIERPWMGGSGDVTFLLGGLAFTALSIAHGYNVPSFEVPPSTLKKATTGSGKASKAEMMAIVEGWGFKPIDDNEADAIALMTYAIERETI